MFLFSWFFVLLLDWIPSSTFYATLHILEMGSWKICKYITRRCIVITETKGFPSEVCHSWVKIDSQQEAVPKEAKETIYSNKSAELTKVMENINRGALSESMWVSPYVRLFYLCINIDVCLIYSDASSLEPPHGSSKEASSDKIDG